MFGFIFGLITTILVLYNLLVLVHFILELVKVPQNKWTELLRSIVEPALKPTRELLKKIFPKMDEKGIDWSPLALFVIISVACAILGWLGSILP